MVCLFGHKWNGCKCEKCGKTRDEHHNWGGVNCSVCGKGLDIETIDDQVLLAKIACSDNYTRHPTFENNWSGFDELMLRKKAVQKLTDQKSLADVINNVELTAITEIALKKLTDQALLTDIAQNRGIVDCISLGVIEKLTNKSLSQKFLEDIAKNNNSDEAIRFAAAEKLTNKPLAQKILADIAKNDNAYEDIRLAAVRKLTDKALAQNILAEIIKKSNSVICTDLRGHKRMVTGNDSELCGDTRYHYTNYKCQYCGFEWQETTGSERW